MSQSGAVILIHNKEEGRLAHIRPALVFLAKRRALTYFEIFEQPSIDAVFFGRWLKRAQAMISAERLWCEHRGVDAPSLYRRMRHTWRSRPRSLRQRRIGAIEKILSDKHVAAWRECVSDGYPFVMIVEDDALFRDDSGAKLDRMFDLIEGLPPEGDLYVNVAGGVDLPLLGLDRVGQKEFGEFISYERPVTNTTCCYVLSSGTMQRFCAMLDREPWYRHLPADWMMNMLMVERMKANETFTCWHANPPFLDHGSALGLYASRMGR